MGGATSLLILAHVLLPLSGVLPLLSQLLTFLRQNLVFHILLSQFFTILRLL